MSFLRDICSKILFILYLFTSKKFLMLLSFLHNIFNVFFIMQSNNFSTICRFVLHYENCSEPELRFSVKLKSLEFFCISTIVFHVIIFWKKKQLTTDQLVSHCQNIYHDLHTFLNHGLQSQTDIETETFSWSKVSMLSLFTWLSFCYIFFFGYN